MLTVRGLALGFCLASTAAHGQGLPRLATPDPGPFAPFVTLGTSDCAPLAAISAVAKTVESLTPDQFQFVRGVFVTLPPVSHELPPGDAAILAKAGEASMVAIVNTATNQTCARFVVPKFMLDMLEAVKHPPGDT